MNKELKEDAPTNAIGTSSSTPGTGAVDTYDPILFQRKQIVRRVVGTWKKGKGDGGIRK
jgi:hypothetical protein